MKNLGECLYETKDLLTKTESNLKLISDAERLKRFFAPGSKGAERKYVVCIESSMTKIPPENYAGSAITKVDLELAGREYGSFQTALLTKPGFPLKGVNAKISELKDKNGKALTGGKIKSFMVDYITTAKPSQTQTRIADVLLPGTEFKLKQPLETLPLWFDVYLPPNSAPGEYTATISITPDGLPSVDIPVTLKALPFNLPLKASLPNAFCFADSWVEGYYKKKIPQQKRYEYMQFILDHRLEPMNLWLGKKKSYMNEEELAWAEKRGKAMLFLSISKIDKSEQYYRDIIKKFDGKLKPVFFGYDEVLMVSKKRHGYLEEMQLAFNKTKEKFPNIPRLNTSEINKSLFGYVDIWCPLFSHFNSKDAEEREVMGEEIWWYPTDYPLQPYANFNLDSPGIDPRVIPWMNWKLNISGLLYWGLNREWLTNHQEAERLTQKGKSARGLDWMTQEVQEKIKKGMRWPEVPWIPYFRSVVNKNASPSTTNGGGNMMYPGPDFQPLSSIRLKNLRDGMQDYEYFVILKKNIQKLEEQNADKELIAQAQKALCLDEVVGGATVYTKAPEVLSKAKAKLALLIVRIQNELRKKEFGKNGK
jgi:glycosyl hydrolase family 123